MDPKNQPKGKFSMNINFRHRTNADAPAINGRISTPDEPEVLYAFEAFANERDGKPYWIGPVNMHRSMRQALLAEETPRGHNFVTIRINEFKVFKELEDGKSPNPKYLELSDEERAKEDAKPAYWGSWTRNPETDQVLRTAAWEREPNRRGYWASGNTYVPMTRDQVAQMANEPEYGQDPGIEIDAAAELEAPRKGKKSERSGR